MTTFYWDGKREPCVTFVQRCVSCHKWHASETLKATCDCGSEALKHTSTVDARVAVQRMLNGDVAATMSDMKGIAE